MKRKADISMFAYVILLSGIIVSTFIFCRKEALRAPQMESVKPIISKIAFTSDRDGNYEIYIMNIDGTNLTRLTNNSTDDHHPKWSPDGSKIAFFSNSNGNNEVYVMNSDGTNKTRLTNHPGQDTQPIWSPDGSQMAFSSNRAGNMNIYIMNADGSNQIRLTNTDRAAAVDPIVGLSAFLLSSNMFPSWPRNGSCTYIVFLCLMSCFHHISL